MPVLVAMFPMMIVSTTAIVALANLLRRNGAILRKRRSHGGLFRRRYDLIRPRGQTGGVVDIHIAERFHVLARTSRSLASIRIEHDDRSVVGKLHAFTIRDSVEASLAERLIEQAIDDIVNRHVASARNMPSIEFLFVAHVDQQHIRVIGKHFLQFRVIKFHSKPFVINCFHDLGRVIIRSDGSARRTNTLSRGVSYG